MIHALSRRLFGGLVGAALLLPLPALAQTITVTDVLDRQVEIPENPQRILLGFYFEDTFAVGGPDVYERVVGISRDAWEGWRGLQWKAYVEAVPRIDEIADVGEVDAGTFSLEAALATQPDVAIIAAWQYDVLGDAVGRMEDAGVPVVVLDYNAQQVEKHVASTLALGAILGEEERAKELADLYAGAHADVAARVAKADSKPRVYVELGRKGADEVDNSYGNTMWGALIDSAGGENIAMEQVAKWGPLSPEYVLAQNPEFVFFAGSGWLSRDKAVIMGPGIGAEKVHARMEPYLGRPGWDNLSAVSTGEVHALYHGGARTLYDFAFFQYIAKTLHPELFEDVDPQANLTAFFEDYMPISFDGTYMTQLP
ncbi:MAG: ABC transporter substrate-binding protein [Pseudomonadota bacterium]